MIRDTACKMNDFVSNHGILLGSAEQIMIRDTACKMNDFRVKDLSHSGAMACNLCLELAHFPLQPHRNRFIQHFLYKLC